jgi:hypothetical protein
VRVAGSVVSIQLAGLLVSSCAREPLEAICPDLGEGDLVVTEVRGPQRPEDLLGDWVELYNASGQTIDLAGTRIRFRRKDGSSEIPILVRRSVEVAAGAYVVLGKGDDNFNPEHIDYSFGNDFAAGWLSAAAVDVETCGLRVDRAVYDTLPDTGTFSLGVMPPNADDNDLPASWCTDATPAGTPRAPNTACPPP